MASSEKTASRPDGEQKLAVPSISLPKGGGAIRGIGEKFAANPVTGTGSMSVPLATSPGRSGFGPQLSLSYDSGSGNGPFGFGWSLSLPAITRKTEKGLPQYRDAEESDVYILSGAEDLVPVLEPDGTRFKDDTTAPGYVIHRYRPRIEGLFARIERWTKVATGEIHWRSITRDNVTTLYGKDNNSRIFDPADSSRVSSWLICESYDDKANAIAYEYQREDSQRIFEDQQGQFVALAHERNRDETSRSANRYLKRIKYGNRTPNRDATTWQATDPAQLPNETWMFDVVFDYGEGHYTEDAPDAQGRIFARAQSDPPAESHWPVRQDRFSTYRAGFEVRTYRLCRRVLMFHHFPQELGINDCLVRSTEFSYSESPIASFITGVTQSGYVRQPHQNQPNRYLKKSLPPLEFEYSQVPSPEQLARQPIRELDAESVANLPVGLGGASYQWMDLDGEGTSGILTEQADGWYYKRNLSANNQVRENGRERTAARFGPVEVIAGKPAVSLAAGAQFLDLAGDGQVDVVTMEGAVRGFYERTDDAGWSSFRPFVAWPNVDTGDPNLRFVDLNGDGHADILITEGEVLTWYPSLAEEGFGPAVRVSLPLDEEKGPRLVFADGTQSIYLADLSGDGLSDLVRIRNGEVCYWPNLGYGRFGAKVTMDDAPWFDSPDQFDQRHIRLADIDGSGNNDIIYLSHDGVRLYFNQSGNRWSEPRRLSQLPRIDNLSSVTAADLLGNGTACLVWSSPLPGDARRPMRYVDLMGGQKPHLLIKTINNLGAEMRVAYAPSTKFYLRDKYDGKPWITRLPFPVHVVERVETYDRISRNRFVTCYAYHHGYFDGIEREFRGFGLVEQWDTEEFSTLSASTDFPSATNIDAASHVPPVWTKTWFHTGAYFEGGRISRQFEAEYYREGDPSLGEGQLTDAQLERMLLPDTVLPDDLSPEDMREACRSLKGAILRQEICALDRRPDGSLTEESDRPYSASERNYAIKRLQSRGPNKHAVFFTHPRESIEYHYERKLYQVNGKLRADPRVTHAMTLEVDEYGNVLKSVAIGYGRRNDDPDPQLTAQDRSKQKQTLITYTENRYTNPVLLDDDYRTPLPCESRTYELIKVQPDASQPLVTNLFRFEEMQAKVQAAGDGAHDLPYEDLEPAGATANHPYRRLIEHVRTVYRKNDLTGCLPLVQLQSLALPCDTYKLAFTPSLAKKIYVDSGKLTAADLDGVLQNEGHYVHSEGDGNWWIPSGRVFYHRDPNATPAQELVEAQKHFFLPRLVRDPFHHDTIVTYDAHDMLVTETKDALGTTVKATNEYRVLQPKLVTDPNSNRSEVTFDALGLVVGTALMGKENEPDGKPKGDLMEGFEPDLTQAQLGAFMAKPREASANANESVATQIVHDLLQKATTRIVYDLDRFRRLGEPPFAAAIARETHVGALASGQISKLQISFSYSDGFGREIQKKIQAEPGPVPKRDANGRIIVDANNQPEMTDHDVEPRWVGSGWTVFNNKGKPVRQYEPFFSDTHKFDFEPKIGVSPILFYDPVERVIATLHPNHTWEKVVFDPWQQTTFDGNDTVASNGTETGDPRTDPHIKGYVAEYFKTQPVTWQTWHAQRVTGAKGVQEQDAATNAAAHANTPTRAHFDSIGRTFLTIADNGASGKYPTGVVLDIEGKPLAIIDARGNTVMAYRRRIPQADGSIRLVTGYDVAGNQLYQNSMDAGERWVLNDVTAKPIRRWDGRNHEFIHKYDALRRPIEIRVKGGDRTPLLDNLYEKIVYGEGKTLNGKADTALNLRAKPFEHYDTAGKVRFEEYDFKGNLLKSSRRLANDYKGVVNWGVADPDAPLETESFPSETKYDALNRAVSQTAPDGSITRPRYNEANLLEAVEVEQPGATTSFVSDINYNEKGQRLAIAYGSGVTTTYAYDRETFRLIHLQSKKGTTLLQDLYYTYDPVGNISQIEDRAQPTRFFNNMKIEPVKEYTYDPLYRLTNAKGGEHIAQVNFGTEDNWHDAAFGKQYNPNDPMEWRNYQEQYAYDPVGNIQKVDHVANGGGWTRTYDYEARNNRLVSTTVGAQTYNYSHHPQHGFITFMPHLQTMEWNFRDELQAVAKERRTGGATPGTTYYVYDSSGQRVRKITENAAPANATATKKAERIYLGKFVIYRQHSGTHVGLERKTLHVMDDKQRIAMIETRNEVDDGTDQRLVRYQLGNHLSSVSLETADNGRVISYEEYHPYGTTAYQAVDKTIKAAAKRYRYSGKERDEESGLYYYGARYYASWLGRWTACDPLGHMDSVNCYQYVRGRAITHVDPHGLQTYEHATDPKAAADILTGGFKPEKGASGYAWFEPKGQGTTGGPSMSGKTAVISAEISAAPEATLPYKMHHEWFKEAEAKLAKEGLSGRELQRAADAERWRRVGEYLKSEGKASYRIELGKGRGHYLALNEAGLASAKITRLSGAGAGEVIANLTLAGKSQQAAATGEMAGLSAAAAKRFGQAASVIKWVGRPLVAVAVAADAYEIYRAENKPRTVTSVVAGWGAAWAGAKGGAWAGARIGAGIALVAGQLGPQVAVPEEIATVPLGGAIGGIVGAIGGGIGGYFIGRKVTETVYDWAFE